MVFVCLYRHTAAEQLYSKDRAMIHYSCDRCKRVIDPAQEVRHEVIIGVQTVLDTSEQHELDEDRDYLNELDDTLMSIDLDEGEYCLDGAPRKLRYDLCSECFRRYIQDPLGAELPLHVSFSHN
jgi:hypothetical protein